jgi:hypothetical protein
MLIFKSANRTNFSQLKTYCTKFCGFIPIIFLFGFFQPPQKKATEYQVKAVFLFNFAQFVEWPEQAFSKPESPLIIGILGKDPFGPYLDETVENEKINGHPFEIKRFQNPAQIDTCHILFINEQFAPNLDVVLKSLNGRGILTVSDVNSFIKQGGMVRLATENNKIKLRINLDVIKEEKFIVSSKLLRMAEIASSK